MKQAGTGDTVRVHYRGTLDDGREFDSSTGREPLEVTLGSGEVIPGFESALIGMTEGEQKTVRIEPDEAYGQPDERMVQDVQRAEIPANIDLSVGTVLQAADGQGRQLQVTVKAVDDNVVTLDANHPLAGEALTFELKLDSIAA